MIEALGWIALAGGGAWALGCLALMLGMGVGAGGLETIPRGLFAGAIVAIVWIILVVWWSPLAIGVQ
jgi:hypothetical protein